MENFPGLLVIFGGSFALALSGALMPGPLFTITVADSVRRGAAAGPLLMIGHSILELALVCAVIFGAGPLLGSPAFTGAASLAGGCIMLWMGAGMIRSAAGLSLKVDPGAARSGALSNPVVTGVLASVSNPYWIIWWATIGLGYLVSAQKAGFVGVAVFFFGHISADISWYTFVSFTVSRGKGIMSDGVYRGVIRVCGAALIFFSGWFLYSAARFAGEILASAHALC